MSNLAASALFFQAVEAAGKKFTIFRKLAKILAVSNWNQVFLLMDSYNTVLVLLEHFEYITK